LSAEAEVRIKRYAIECGASVAGIASVEDINRYAPEGHRPDDILPNAKSVVVTGGPLYTKGAWRSPTPRITILTEAYPLIRKAVALKVVNLLEREYAHYAIFYEGQTESGHNPFLSLKLCAEMAGLGTRALAGGVILNRNYGLLNFNCVITTMPLKPDGPQKDSVCPYPSCVKMWDAKKTTPCLTACPTCLSGQLENGRIKWMQFRRYLCEPRAQTTSTTAFRQKLLEIINEKDPEKRKQLIYGDFFGRIIRSIAFSSELIGGCIECLRYCPVCMKANTLRPTPK